MAKSPVIGFFDPCMQGVLQILHPSLTKVRPAKVATKKLQLNGAMQKERDKP